MISLWVGEKADKISWTKDILLDIEDWMLWYVRNMEESDKSGILGKS